VDYLTGSLSPGGLWLGEERARVRGMMKHKKTGKEGRSWEV
jgi:hypothetical protein